MPVVAEASSDLPERIGNLVIVREVGRGSTGTVYLANDPQNGRQVAVKIYNLQAEGGGDPSHVAHNMFLSEARLVGMLQHPYILPIYDAGEESGCCYIVTEYVHDARTLAAYCRTGSLLPLDVVIEVMFKCAKALHYAHLSGVIHRDIKPSNILLTQDRDVRIIDFGIALLAGSEVAQIDGIAGSPSYMSPEQVQSQPLTNRSDLYSLGAVMYELITGTRPFKAGDLQKLLHQIIYATPPPIHTLNRDVPEEIENVVAIALQKDPAKRYSSGLDFAAELARSHQRLHGEGARMEHAEQLEVLRSLKFFQEFSPAEIREVLRASRWQVCLQYEEIVREGEVEAQGEDCFYVVVAGQCVVERRGERLGVLDRGDCFGEAVTGAMRGATVRALSPVTVLKVNPALLQQASGDCQDRFNRVFLRTAVGRLRSLQGASS
jgi:CRP-like cAMP-binding protein